MKQMMIITPIYQYIITPIYQYIITPISKGGYRNLPKNYRPVALTSYLIKILKKILEKNYTHIPRIASENEPHAKQHGFLSGRPCLPKMLEHHKKILEELEKSNNVDVIYLDFAKAFDKVDHCILLNELKKIGINGKVGLWIPEFLSKRQQCLAVNGTTSNEANVRRGVPKGSVLGPLLSLIHISDINYEIDSNPSGNNRWRGHTDAKKWFT